jgi:PAS domain S-box-containing protein
MEPEDGLRPEEIERIRRGVDAIPAFIWSARADGSPEFLNRRWSDYTGLASEEVTRLGWKSVVHPDDLLNLVNAFGKELESHGSFSVENRIRRFDGIYRWFLTQGSPLYDETGAVNHWHGINTDIDDQKRAEETLRTSEGNLRQTLDSIPGLVCVMGETGEIEFANHQMTEYFGRDLGSLSEWATNDVFHPDDRTKVIESWSQAVRICEPQAAEHRLRRADGVYRWFQTRMLPLKDENGRILRWHCLLTDIEERKQAEVRLQRSEKYLAEAQKLAHSGSWSWTVSTLEAFWSREMFRLLGYEPEEIRPSLGAFFERVHPEDRTRMERVVFEEETKGGADCPSDYRLVLPGGATKHIHCVAHPVTNGSGEVVEVIGTSMDVTEQVAARESLEKALAEIKLLKDRLDRENVALREEVDRTSMFEEIIGNSKALQAALSRVDKVAPTDSSVLITGETGTGKELIARAIHKKSQRSQHAFVSVNCSALAPSLILSELFGHEKGAFTGAVQRRVGRFELANGGTIFLDEVGELPSDTQAALLRVLQEREFERVGGKQPIHVDVRVIAATNRNLVAAMANGLMRPDLFYRLNVFPIELPPLRERREDIVVLLEYFVRRLANKAGKNFKRIDRRTLNALQTYNWPGNVRELQNVVERSVIVTSGDVFRVDESWLLSDASGASIPISTEHPEGDSNSVRDTIEHALRASRGRVSGPKGAAVRLNLPPSTLDGMIKKLNIRKERFKLS